jgi:hypothetical protein
MEQESVLDRKVDSVELDNVETNTDGDGMRIPIEVLKIEASFIDLPVAV